MHREPRFAMTCLDLSLFSVHTEKLVEVLFERDRRCPRAGSGVTMLCSRVEANDRFSDNSNVSLFVEYDENMDLANSDDEFDLHSDKRKLHPSLVENEFSNIPQLFDTEPNKINAVLKNIGLVCNIDKMYTMKPSQLFYYTCKISSYSLRNDFFLKSDILNSKELNNSQNYHEDYSLTLNNSRQIYKKKISPSRNISQNKIPVKYWSMRHMLFSKFDFGIMLDRESFYSVCPEILSYHIAKRCKNDIAMDPFCGAGGNIIQLALTCKLVIAIDIDPAKIQFAKSNAEIYGVADKIEFITGDFFAVSSMLQADVIFMSPPWGGPEYLYEKSFSIEAMCKDHYGGGFGIFSMVKEIAPNIAFHMPRTTNIYDCLWLAKDLGKVEIQQNIINKKLNSITAFYGEFNDITDNDY